MKWVYFCEDCYPSPMSEAALNAAGAEGWELVACSYGVEGIASQRSMNAVWHYVFKKPRVEEDD